ncbi:hypothetical protein P389DRAFT_108674 [Cystobasidium minutum MCA 4210]|uniref:uncharacterized protein n=1 Tax=Cystobasidium minutum MCA 4210 TaxID=1397322 RepID=UPI0034CEF239|eukprot:jgi/Rhomi1/108674/CE108673_1332
MAAVFVNRPLTNKSYPSFSYFTIDQEHIHFLMGMGILPIYSSEHVGLFYLRLLIFRPDLHSSGFSVRQSVHNFFFAISTRTQKGIMVALTIASGLVYTYTH